MMNFLFPRQGKITRSRRAHSRYGIENLENRYLLTLIGDLPMVTDVNVSSTQWSSDFIDYLEDQSMGKDGYSIPVGSSNQLKTLPWNNLDQIRITFNIDVEVQQSDLSLSGVNTTAYSFSDFSYNSLTKTAVWTLSAPLGRDAFLIDLNGDGLDPVSDGNGNDLDGEWTNGGDTYSSGNGLEGGDFEFRFNVLPGDTSQNGFVSFVDQMAVAQRYNKTVQDVGYSAFHDVNGNGAISPDDAAIVYGQVGNSTTVGDPAGANNDAPSTQGFANVEVDEDAVDQVLSLWDAFDDAEDNDQTLTYSVVSNTNSALFAAVTVDAVNGELILDYAENAYGSAELVIRATDSGGLFTDTVLSVDVAAVNDPPVISDFVGTLGPGNVWYFTGTVTDVDDDVTGFIVTFGGVLSGANSTTVHNDGIFDLIYELPPTTWGHATCQTEDDELASNTALFFVA